MMRGDKIYRSGALSVDEKARCAALVQAFVTGPVKREDEDLGMPPFRAVCVAHGHDLASHFSRSRRETDR